MPNLTKTSFPTDYSKYLEINNNGFKEKSLNNFNNSGGLVDSMLVVRLTSQISLF